MYSVHAEHDVNTILLLPALSAGFTKQQQRQQQQRLLPEHLMLFEYVTTKSDTCTLQNKIILSALCALSALHDS